MVGATGEKRQRNRKQKKKKKKLVDQSIHVLEVDHYPNFDVESANWDKMVEIFFFFF